MSTVTGSERVLVTGVEVVLVVVRMPVYNQFPTSMPTLYLGFYGNGPEAVRPVGCDMQGF